jgi:hypothetical protein
MYWVTMTDKGMSGWGMAKGKVNKLVISCNTWDEALVVEANAKARGEMKHVNIRTTKPYYPGQWYFVSRHGRTEGDYESWFTKQEGWKGDAS